MGQTKYQTGLLLAAAFVLLFAGLGTTSLWGSEDRWAEISRNMLLYNDFFHPCINGEIYYDKPLLSYWLIAIPGLLLGGVNEFVVRLPSAAAALIGIWATLKLGEKRWNRQTGLLAAWILLTCLGFLFWARKGAADLENLTSIVLAVCWYYYRKDRPGFVTYAVFILICVIGAHTKGLPAIAVPVVAVVPDLLRHRNWRQHLRPSLFGAAAIGLAVYLAPFL
ncbi:MAG: glycosyltransferase family 39 protein, partial [Victivallales bacterium]|nr:glycosyltransferase family 39 protein [Victivallales bacterium]